MTTPEHERLERLFNAALERKQRTERSAFLDGACDDDSDLRMQVEGLLSAHDRAGSFLNVPAVDPQATLESSTRDDVTGTRIGRYKILQEIGEGGFGCVYMAEQEEPVRRKVALKIIKLGMDTKQVIARFEAERQALALMDHPNIARVFDAGSTETGRPYFVMELVKGITITEYCDQAKLPPRQRLELFVDVCHAIQHAHQKGVIHRDLKPNNVLVTLHDGRPVPKVIDFGIAKATSQRLTEKTLFTEFRQFLGTPEYMSPDQAEISGLDVDTRTDIYSLGVLLYELLTGTTPFEGKTLRQASYGEIQRIVREVEPPMPSVRLRTLSTTRQGRACAVARGTEPAMLSRLVRGDLDWIVTKAMEKDRTRRYATAKDLADDVERHLSNEPVEAGPPSVTYKFRKFAQRHRVGMLVGTLAGAAVVAGLSLATIGLVQATTARDALKEERDSANAARISAQQQRTLAEASEEEALKEALKAATVNQFIQGMLRSVDPGEALGREVTVRYVLDEAAREVTEGALADQPEVEAAIRATLGETYLALGLHDDAEPHLQAAYAVRTELLGADNRETLRSARALASLLRAKGRFAAAETLLRQTAETQTRVLGEEHADTLATMTELALSLWGPERYAEAEAIHRKVLAILRRVRGEDHVDTLTSLVYVGAVCRELGKIGEAEAILREAWEASRRALGAAHPCTTSAMNHLAVLLEKQGSYANAEELFTRTYELDRVTFGPDHPRTLDRLNDVVRILLAQGKVEQTRPLVSERLAHLRREAERPGATALALHSYAWELLNCEPADLRDAAAALPVAKLAVERDGGNDANMLDTLSRAYEWTGDLVQAAEMERRALARANARGQYGRDEYEGRLSRLLALQGDVVGAVGLSWGGLASRVTQSLATDTGIGASPITRGEALIKEGRFEDAEAYLSRQLMTMHKQLPAGHWFIAEATSQLGEAIAGSGDLAQAEQLLLDGYEEMRDNEQVSTERKRIAIRRIVALYESWGRPDQAAEWRQRLDDLTDESDQSGADQD